MENIPLEVDLKIRTATLHNYINIAKNKLKENKEEQLSFFLDMIDREQRGIEKIQSLLGKDVK